MILHKRLNISMNPNQLAILRIVIGLNIIYAASSKIFDLLLHVKGRQNVIVLLPLKIQEIIYNSYIPSLRIITIVLAIFLVLGLFTKYILPFLTFCFLVLFSFYYKGVNAPIHWLYLWFPLIVLCFSKCSDVISIDSLVHPKEIIKSTNYTWPIELIRLWFVYIYFFAGIAKILPLEKFVLWVNGETSRNIIYNRYLDSPFHYIFGQPFFDYSKPSIIFSILSIMAVVLEVSTVLILVTKRYNVLILFMIISMHFFLYMCGVAGFMQTALILGITLLPNKWFNFKKV